MQKKYVYIKKDFSLLSVAVKETRQGPLNGFSREQNSGFPILLFFSLYFFAPPLKESLNIGARVFASVLFAHQGFKNAQAWLTNADLQSFGLPTEQSSRGTSLTFYFLSYSWSLFFFFFFLCLFNIGKGLLTDSLRHGSRFFGVVSQKRFKITLRSVIKIDRDGFKMLRISN